MINSYKFRIYPNDEQKVIMNKNFGSVRFVYNHFLELKTNNHSLKKYDSIKLLPSLKQEYGWLKENESSSLQQTIIDLYTAFDNFFSHRTSYPVKKKKSFHKDSYRIMMNCNNIKIINNKKIKLPKLKNVKINNQKQDYLHKLSKMIVTNFEKIAIENLDISSMMVDNLDSRIAEHNINRSLLSMNFREFRTMLEYKCKKYGKELIIVDRYFPSSQKCSHCGEINPEIRNLNIREWTCPHCNATHDRDVNAAKNLLLQI